MSEPMIGLLGVVILMVLLSLKMPIAFALALVGFAGFAVIVGLGGALTNLRLIPWRYIADYNLAVLPLFILMGSVTANTGVTQDLYSSAYTWVGQFRGGLAMSTVMATGAFGAVCGLSLAAVATFGRIVKPEMERYNYDPKLAAGSVAAGSTLTSLIPPSLPFIIYGILCEQSIGRLFIAGIFPGITEIIFYFFVIYIICRRNPQMGPAGPKTSLKAKLVSLKKAWATLALFVLVMGGIYMGIFTPTEAGGIGAFGAIVIGLIQRRLTVEGFINSIGETARISAMALLIFVGAMLFSGFIAVSQLPFMLSETISNLAIPDLAVIVVILIIYLFLGCFFDIITTLVLTLPIMFPVVEAMGFDPIWYGVLMVRIIEIGVISPPFGLDCFVVAGAMNVRVGTVFRGIIPFVIADLFNVALLVAIPQISLFLPNMMLRL
jgi:C4-dicarboxylate transporter DctM subunit